MSDKWHFFGDIGEKMKVSGRRAIADLHAHGRPGIYMRDGEMVWEWPGGVILNREQSRAVDNAIATQRLAGLPSDPETVAMTAKVAAGLVSDQELQTWIDEQVEEIKREERRLK